MALARKCDICGNYYDKYGTKNSDKRDNALIFAVLFDDYSIDKKKILDCCPNCMKEIKEKIKELGRNDVVED